MVNLLKILFRILFANFRRGRLLKNKRALFTLLALCIMPLLIILQTREMFYAWLLMPNLGETFLLRFVASLLSGLMILLILTGLPGVMHHFFLAPDLALLQTLPIPSYAIFLQKILQSVVNNLGLFAAIGLPLLISLAIAFDMSVAAYVTIFFGSIVFIFIPTGIAALIAFALARLFSVKRMRRISTLILGLFIILTWAGFQVLQLSRLNPVMGKEYDPAAVDTISAFMAKINIIPLPSDWLVSSVHSAHVGEWSTVTINFLLLVGLAVVLSILIVFWRTNLQNKNIQIEAQPRRRSNATPSVAGAASSFVKAMFAKDNRLMFRDTRFFQSSFLLMAMLLLAPFFASASSSSTEETLAFYMPYIPVTILTLIVSSTFARQSLPMERLAFFWLLQAPISAEKILWSKFVRIVSFVLPVAFLSVLTAAIKNDSMDKLFGILLLHGGFVICGASLGMVNAVLTTKFNWSDPRDMVNPAGVYLASFIVLLIGGLGLVIIGTGFYIEQLIIAFLIFFVYVFLVLWLSLRMAKIRLTKLDWIY